MSADERPREQRAPAPASVEARALRCRRCDAEVSDASLVFSVGGAPAVGAYANAAGYLRQVVSLRDAWGLALSRDASGDLTWFAGYAWRIAECGGCRAHLGWRYEALDDGLAPPEFYGLLTAAIVGL